jgi:hypothetical protein
VAYQVDVPANPGNVFTAQLSNKSGSFASPVNIGTVTSTGSGNIACTIPASTPTGTKYKVRVVSSSPVVIGSVSTKTLKINPKPTGLTVTGITCSQETLNWIAVTIATSYKVQYKSSTSSTWSATIDVGLATSYAFPGLHAGTSYDFQVRSVCGTGTKSDWSKITSSTAACPVPTGLIVSAIGITTSSLNWNDAACATDYSFRYRAVGEPVWIYKHPVPSFIDLTGLLPATLYEAQVATRCSTTDTSAFTASAIWETNYFRLGDASLSSGFNIFPNPSNGEFTLQYNAATENMNVEISVQNIYGQVVFHENKQSVQGLNEQQIALRDAAAGLYYVSIKSGDKEFKSSLMVK